MIAGAPNACPKADHLPDKILRRRAFFGVGIGQAQTVNHHPRPGAHGRDLEIVFFEQTFERIGIHRIGRRGENFHGVKPQRRRLPACGGQIVPKHKRPPAGFLHQTHGHCGSNHSFKSLSRRKVTPRTRLCLAPLRLGVKFNAASHKKWSVNTEENRLGMDKGLAPTLPIPDRSQSSLCRETSAPPH